MKLKNVNLASIDESLTATKRLAYLFYTSFRDVGSFPQNFMILTMFGYISRSWFAINLLPPSPAISIHLNEKNNNLMLVVSIAPSIVYK